MTDLAIRTSAAAWAGLRRFDRVLKLEPHAVLHKGLINKQHALVQGRSFRDEDCACALMPRRCECRTRRPARGDDARDGDEPRTLTSG